MTLEVSISQAKEMIAIPTLLSVDFDYLRRVAQRSDPAAILLEQKFLDAQKLFFRVVAELGGTVDFEVADMHEIHAVAALHDVPGQRVLDLGCGSPEAYVLEDTFRDRYPPFFAEMLARLGADVTGVDHRKNDTARYDHRVLDLVSSNWTASLEPPYNLITCFSLFNAPESPFERDEALCNRIMRDVQRLLAPDGIVIANLYDGVFEPPKGFSLMHLDGNCAWMRPATQHRVLEQDSTQ